MKRTCTIPSNLLTQILTSSEVRRETVIYYYSIICESSIRIFFCQLVLEFSSRMLHEVYSRSSRERQYYDNMGHYNIFSYICFVHILAKTVRLLLEDYLFCTPCRSTLYHLRPKSITLNEPLSVSLSLSQKTSLFLFI